MRSQLALPCVAALCLTITATLPAQGARGARVVDRFGFLIGASNTANGGLNAINPDGSGLSGFSLSPGSLQRSRGFDIAAYARLPLTNAISLQPELHYTVKGAGNTAQYALRAYNMSLPTAGVAGPIDGTLNVTGRTRLAYAELPILLRFDSPALVGGVRMMVLAGPSVGLRLSCRNEQTVNDATTSGRCQAPQEIFVNGSARFVQQDVYKRHDASGIIGAGVSVMRASHVFTAQVRYSHGLVPIARIPMSSQGNRTNGLALLFGVGR